MSARAGTVASALLVALLLLMGIAAPAAWAGPEGGRYRLTVPGLSCPFCAYGIEKKLGALEEVQSVEVDLDEGAVLVRTRPGEELTEERARTAVEAAGFGLQGFEVPAPASGDGTAARPSPREGGRPPGLGPRWRPDGPKVERGGPSWRRA